MSAKRAAWIWIGIYLAFTIVQYFFFDLLLFDYLTYIVIIILLLFLSRKFVLPSGTIWLFGISTLPHSIGMIPFSVAGERVSLYHDMFFLGYYDVFTHFVGFTIITIGFLHFYMHNHHEASRLTLALIFFGIVGMGTFVELSEFLGYAIFGFGWGAFAFGAGDNSANFGPWGDSMTDQLGNITGITFGFLLYFLWYRYAAQARGDYPVKKVKKR